MSKKVLKSKKSKKVLKSKKSKKVLNKRSPKGAIKKYMPLKKINWLKDISGNFTPYVLLKNGNYDKNFIYYYDKNNIIKRVKAQNQYGSVTEYMHNGHTYLIGWENEPPITTLLFRS